MRNDGGLAFPDVQGVYDGMSLRDYACVQLRIPDTDKPWLNEIIQKARLDWFAGMALMGLMSAHDEQGMWTTEGANHRAAQISSETADAMLVAREKN